jgi:hypothetical protein
MKIHRDVLQLSGLLAGDVKESRNDNPTRDLQMAADRIRPHTLCGPVVEHRLRRADGVYRWFQVRGRPQHDAEGHIIRWYNLVTDIDDRKRAEGQLAEERTRQENFAFESKSIRSSCLRRSWAPRPP